MVRIRVRRSVLLATAAAIAAGIAFSPARAVELRDLAGWWIAIDDTFPKHWKARSIAPMEEVVQINPDGRVTDRVVNFWAGGHQACLDNKVCSDLPQISLSRLQVAGNRLSFVTVTPTTARLDTQSGEATVRRDAISATANWQVSLDGNRMTLRTGNPARVRVLARIDFERLRRLHAGMRVSSFAPAEHWRCFLANATAQDKAYAPLHTGRTGAPEFLDRYLNIASYMDAIRSAMAIPAIDEANEDQRKLLSVEPDEQLVQHYEGVLRPPSVDDRKRLGAVLDYIERHTRTMIAHDAAAAVAADAKARADAAAAEAAQLLALWREADTASAQARNKSAAAAADLVKARSIEAERTQAAKDQAEAARLAEADATAKQGTAVTALAAFETARRAAADQQQKLEAARSASAAAQQKLDAAIRLATELAQRSIAATDAARAQERKAEASRAAAAERQRSFEAARRAADQQQQKFLAAKLAADAQDQKAAKLAAAAREFEGGLASWQKTAEETAALLERTQAAAKAISDAIGGPGEDATSREAADAAREVNEAAATLQASLRMTTAALRIASAARERSQKSAAAAAALAAELGRTARGAEQASNDAANAAKSAEAAANRAEAEAQAAAREHTELVRAAEAAAKRATEAQDAVKSEQAAREAASASANAAADESRRTDAAARAAETASAAAQEASRKSAAARDKAKADAEAASREASRSTAAAQAATRAATEAEEAQKAAAAREQQAKARSDAAAQVSTRANAEHQTAARSAAAARDAMQAAAASQPKGEGLVPIASADIAALAHVVNESDDAKRLFCRGQYAAGPMLTPVSVAAPASPPAAVPTAPEPAQKATTEGQSVKVPLPVARPSTLRR